MNDMTDDFAHRPISDETLMRFADGELPPHERELVSAELARDPALARRLEAFRFTREDVRDAYSSTLTVPGVLSKRLDVIGLSSARNASAPRVLELSRLRAPVPSRRILALAAAIALLLAAAGWLLRDSLHPDYAWLDGSPALQRALDATLSHETAPIGKSISIEVVSTFASNEKSWCREFKIIDGVHHRASAVACRNDLGNWEVNATGTVTASEEVPDRRGTYGIAGATRPKAVADYVDNNLNADVSAGDELSLIEHHWSRQP